MARLIAGWIGAVLALDRLIGPSARPWLAIATWGVLLLALAKETADVRAHTAIVIAFATVVEYTFSPLLHVYLYRDGGVPGFVPPGHGLTYLGALALGRAVSGRHLPTATVAVVVAGAAYALSGLVPGHRLDVLGAFWFCCLLGFLRWGPSRPLYVGAAVMVTYLELAGTSLGTWSWQPHDPTGLVAIGNPPSGAAGGYGWFDLAALLGAPMLLAQVRRAAAAVQRVRARAAAHWSPARFHPPVPDVLTDQ